MLESPLPWLAVIVSAGLTPAAAAQVLRQNERRRALICRVLLLAASLGLPPRPVSAQPADSLLVKVRLERGGFLLGRAFVIQPDTLTFLPEGRGDTLTLALDSIRELRARRGDQSHFWAGLFIGAGVGALLGAAAGYIDGDDRPDPNSIIDLSPTAEMKAGWGAVLGGVLGAVTGGIIGGSFRTPRFVRIGFLDLQQEARAGPTNRP